MQLMDEWVAMHFGLTSCRIRFIKGVHYLNGRSCCEAQVEMNWAFISFIGIISIYLPKFPFYFLSIKLSSTTPRNFVDVFTNWRLLFHHV